MRSHSCSILLPPSRPHQEGRCSARGQRAHVSDVVGDGRAGQRQSAVVVVDPATSKLRGSTARAHTRAHSSCRRCSPGGQ
eukprot:7242976-Prymnesium_polylepis.2